MVVKNVMGSSKIIKCELSGKDEQSPISVKELTIHNMKPGFLVNAKVARVLENGIELNFLGGFSGTVFIDHLVKGDPSKYKPGEKLTARIVSVDQMTQSITLSTLPHLVKFESITNQLKQEGVTVGNVYEKVSVADVAFGDSYRIEITSLVNGFLHKIHTVKKEKESKKVKDEEVEEGKAAVYT